MKILVNLILKQKKFGEIEHTATTRCATPDTLGWFKTTVVGDGPNGYEKIGDSLYAAKRAIEVTSIGQMNENSRVWP
jgi:hypothetical protein